MSQCYLPLRGRKGEGSLELSIFCPILHQREDRSVREEERVRLGQFLFHSDTPAVEEMAPLLLSQSEVQYWIWIWIWYWLSGPEVTAASIQFSLSETPPSTSSLSSPELWQSAELLYGQLKLDLVVWWIRWLGPVSLVVDVFDVVLALSVEIETSLRYAHSFNSPLRTRGALTIGRAFGAAFANHDGSPLPAMKALSGRDVWLFF